MDTLTTEAKPREQTRARYPDQTGFVERDGVRIFWEAYGTGDQTIMLLPTWEIVHSRIWKGQIPYLARRFRVVTFDPRGNGRSDRPPEPGAYDRREFVADAIAILDTLGVDRAAGRVVVRRRRHHAGRRAPASGCPPWWISRRTA